ncbi:hypothetical protein V5O48_009899 [Marasmius crinis-equi]|uniref:Uncharacterized protein n=1 Tax=Marasmius crinis-equi TaxID=585013 RepID=A0ABR3FA73_9AGAR
MDVSNLLNTAADNSDPPLSSTTPFIPSASPAGTNSIQNVNGINNGGNNTSQPPPPLSSSHNPQAAGRQGKKKKARASEDSDSDSSDSSNSEDGEDEPQSQIGAAEKATRQIAKQLRDRKAAKLAEKLQKTVEKYEGKLSKIAGKFGKSEERIRQLVELSPHYTRRRTPRLDNAILHWMKLKYNTDRPKNMKYTANKLRELAKEEPYLEDIETNLAKQEELLEAIEDQRKSEAAGARVTERSQASMINEAHTQASDIMRRLYNKTAASSFGFVSKHDVMEYGLPGFYAFGDATDFFQETFGMDMWKITRKFELWSTNQADRKKDFSIDALRSKCSTFITNGLKNLRGDQIQMNWINYDTAIVQKHRCHLVGWPDDVDFKSPSSLTTTDDLLEVLEALKSGTCHWQVMSNRELKAHREQMKNEQDGKELRKRAQRADKGKVRGSYKARKKADTMESAATSHNDPPSADDVVEPEPMLESPGTQPPLPSAAPTANPPSHNPDTSIVTNPAHAATANSTIAESVAPSVSHGSSAPPIPIRYGSAKRGPSDEESQLGRQTKQKPNEPVQPTLSAARPRPRKRGRPSKTAPSQPEGSPANSHPQQSDMPAGNSPPPTHLTLSSPMLPETSPYPTYPAYPPASGQEN